MKRFKVFFLTLILSCSMFLGSVAPVNAAAAAVGTLASILGTTVLTSAVGTATSALVNSWLGVNRGYYNGSGSSTSYDYSNNMARNTNLTAGGNITNSGANNENCWNSYVTNNTKNYSLVRNQYDTTINDYSTQIYNPTTNNYHTVNNVSYSNEYNTYYLTSNEYNYYVTNNYTYVSYYITNTTNNETNYYEIYYELPDGRNSFYLTASEVWGEYFLYDVRRADVVAEDDGRTLALYHLDTNTMDYSYHEQQPLPLQTGLYSPGMFENGIQCSGEYIFPMPSDVLGVKDFTIEFFASHKYSGSIAFLFTNNFDLKPGITHFAFQIGADYSINAVYINGSKTVFKPYSSGVYSNGNKPLNNQQLLSRTCKKYESSSDLNYNRFFCEPTRFGVHLGDNFVLDEIRISSGFVYSGDYFSIPAQPFDTNEILVLPDSADQGDIVVAAKSDFKNYRIGGVRPTYPSEGFVHIVLDEFATVHDIQQYYAGFWESCEARIYKDGVWHDLKGFNLESFGVPDTDKLDDSPGGSGGGGNSNDKDNDSGGGSSDSGNGLLGGGFTSIINAISNFLGLILDAIGKVVTLITDFFSSFLSMFDSFTVFSEGFGRFLSSAFIFLPSEVISALVVGINICVVIAVFKFMRN